MISFKIEKKDRELAHKIAIRALRMMENSGVEYRRDPRDWTHWEMNIVACHVNGNPLKLSELLAADDFNFAHDVFGIDRHINRDTGKLENHFSPRFSA